jgi:protein TonB
MTLAPLSGPGAGGASSPIAWAVAASVALHVAVLAGIPERWPHPSAPATAPLNARLEPGPPAAAVAAPAADPPATAERASPRPIANRQVRADRADALRRVVPAADEPAAPPPSPAAPAPLAATAAAAQATGTGEPTLAPRAGDDALDPGSLAQFRLALIGAAKRHRLYPESAVERGWHGRVTVRLAFDADGALAAALVHRSSGHGALDEQALDMLRKAAALTPLPPALRSRGFAVDVPVLFELRGAS